MPNQHNPYEPDAATIAARAAEIRKRWSRGEEAKRRRHTLPRPVEVQQTAPLEQERQLEE